LHASLALLHRSSEQPFSDHLLALDHHLWIIFNRVGCFLASFG
jgi:hypothetical protein